MTFRLRTATLADIPAMHAVRRSVRENRLGDPTRVTENAYLPFIESGSIWVAVDQGWGVVGFSALDPTTNSVWALFVDPDHEGAGIGRALHDIMLDWASQHEIRALWLVTAPGTRAEHFYLATDWTKKGTTSTAETRFEKALSLSA